jgi:hypothetical protein
MLKEKSSESLADVFLLVFFSALEARDSKPKDMSCLPLIRVEIAG